MGQPLSHPITSKWVECHHLSNETQEEEEEEERMKINVDFACMQGYRHTMEDTHIICKSLHPERHPNISIFAIFDGHGGKEVAELAAADLANHVAHSCDNPMNPIQLRQSFIDFDRYLMKQVPENHQSGCTVACVLLKWQEQQHNNNNNNNNNNKKVDVVIAHAGDSRVMILHKVNNKPHFRFVTSDHKPTNAAEAKRITKAGSYISNGRVEASLNVSRGFGDFPLKCRTNVSFEQQPVTALPDISVTTLREHEVLFIGCDGMFEQMKNTEVAYFIQKCYADDTKKAKSIASECIDESLWRNSQDNISAMIIHLTKKKEDNITQKQYIMSKTPYQELKDPTSKYYRAFQQDALAHGVSQQQIDEHIQTLF